MATRDKRSGVAVASVVATEVEPVKPPTQPSQCRTYMRRRLVREFPGIVDGFVKGAKRGSCQHVKLATELLDAKPRPEKAMHSGRRSLKRLVQRLEQIED